MLDRLFDTLKKLFGGGSGGLEISKSTINAPVVYDSQDVTITIENMVDKEALNKDRSVQYKEQGRSKVQAWGERSSRTGEWDWHLLGQAIEYYVDAIKYDPTHQHPWTNLAYVFHLAGVHHRANQCMKKSFQLAASGPNHPGRNYKNVKRAIENDSNLSGGRLQRPELPKWFRDKYGKFLE